MSAAVFLVSPFNVEAVTWASSIFDLCLTACVLSATLVTTESKGSDAMRLGIIGMLAAGALASKETGIALSLLLLLSAAFGGGGGNQQRVQSGARPPRVLSESYI
jgi:hypothetical protein